jgi:hypothetical protein
MKSSEPIRAASKLDCVNEVAYLFVLKEKVDKLCYFEVVHRNGRFNKPIADVEILLYGAF